MFDIAFTELMIAAVIALVIVGPERLPKMARTVGEWAGKLQRYVNDVKSDINKQIQLDELREIQSEVTTAARDLETSVKSTIDSTQRDFDELSRSMDSDDDANLIDNSSSNSSGKADWEIAYEQRRIRERIRDRREERETRLGKKRPPKRRY